MNAYKQPGSPLGRRYTPETRELARRLYDGGAGWAVGEIVRILNDQDIPVRPETVRCWVDDDYRASRAKATTSARRRRDDPKGQFVRRRMLELHHAGLSYKSISVIVDLYHNRRISPDMVRYFISSNGGAA